MNPTEKKRQIQEMVEVAVCVTLLCISSYLVLPLPFTPIVLSLHTVMVNLIGLTLKPKQAASTLAVYLVMGLAGLPVFSGGSAGPGKLLGPTGGFYFGFFFAAAAISLCKGKTPRFSRYALATILLGLPIQHLCAILMMCFYNQFQITSAFLTVSLPFIPGDIAKCLLSSVLGIALNRALPQRGNA